MIAIPARAIDIAIDVVLRGKPQWPVTHRELIGDALLELSWRSHDAGYTKIAALLGHAGKSLTEDLPSSA